MLVQSRKWVASALVGLIPISAFLPEVTRGRHAHCSVAGVDTLNSRDVVHSTLFPVSPPHTRDDHRMLHEVDCVHCRRLQYNSTWMHMSRLGKRGCTVPVLYNRGQEIRGARDPRIGRLALGELHRSLFAIGVVSGWTGRPVCSCVHPCVSACCGKAFLCERTRFSAKLCRLPAAGGLYGCLAWIFLQERKKSSAAHEIRGPQEAIGSCFRPENRKGERAQSLMSNIYPPPFR
jgi:hypothetical protein